MWLDEVGPQGPPSPRTSGFPNSPHAIVRVPGGEVEPVILECSRAKEHPTLGIWLEMLIRGPHPWRSFFCHSEAEPRWYFIYICIYIYIYFLRWALCPDTCKTRTLLRNATLKRKRAQGLAQATPTGAWRRFPTPGCSVALVS